MCTCWPSQTVPPSAALTGISVRGLLTLADLPPIPCDDKRRATRSNQIEHALPDQLVWFVPENELDGGIHIGNSPCAIDLIDEVAG